jgi:hypothetical protein
MITDGTEYIGRPSILGNPFTHLETDTLAQFKVDTVEDAINEYRSYFYIRLNTDSAFRNEVARLVRVYQIRGVLYLSCWCKDELKPSKKDHGCHCDVVREFILTTVPILYYYQRTANAFMG